MVRGTTPALTLTIPNGGDLDLTQVEAVYVTLRRKGQIITITGDALTLEPQAVTFHLSQEDSLALSPGEVEVQLNWTYRDAVTGDPGRGASEVSTIVITDQLLTEVI